MKIRTWIFLNFLNKQIFESILSLHKTLRRKTTNWRTGEGARLKIALTIARRQLCIDTSTHTVLIQCHILIADLVRGSLEKKTGPSCHEPLIQAIGNFAIMEAVKQVKVFIKHWNVFARSACLATINIRRLSIGPKTETEVEGYYLSYLWRTLLYDFSNIPANDGMTFLRFR